jgi:tryptophanase
MSPRQAVERALPRRTYGLSHLNRVGEVLAATVKDKERIPGYRLVEQPPLLRHFRSKLEPVQG